MSIDSMKEKKTPAGYSLLWLTTIIQCLTID